MTTLAQKSFDIISALVDGVPSERERRRLLIEHTGRYTREVADRYMFELSQLYRSCCSALQGDDEDIRKKLVLSEDGEVIEHLSYTVASSKYLVYNLICKNASLLVVSYLKGLCSVSTPRVSIETTADGMGWILECENCTYLFNLYRVYDEENTVYSKKDLFRIAGDVQRSKYPEKVKSWTIGQLPYLLSE